MLDMHNLMTDIKISTTHDSNLSSVSNCNVARKLALGYVWKFNATGDKLSET
jgi:hypothetical protein